ncbi:DUF1365 domain-containing protein [Gordonia alkaliphila]|uniref:DUF1365 domain-containing protein n=1 Tax=Gordonia alkaliphila TaxID=1053547 RepID=UPI001FF6D073|nr:DUF1365 domain-containing protein [Gordonia alkaliphila]MCK0439126.1 DUF1365 domain-containing protein [Gordonia alkaliphila]
MTAPVPSLVYTRIRHARREPVDHRFAHSSLSWLVDVDRLPVLPRGLRWTARFRADDHFPQASTPGATLRQRLDEYLAATGERAVDGPVTALLSPRVAGYVFNPLSVFWCHDSSGALRCVVAEVHNTYGQRHCYLVHTDDAGRAAVDKEFYVSPFNDVSGSYRLLLPEPDADGRVHVAITLERPGQPPFTATLRGVAQPATTAAVLRAQLRAPLAPWLVSLRIRIHGVRLWARGLRVQPRPEVPTTPTTLTTPRGQTR